MGRERPPTSNVQIYAGCVCRHGIARPSTCNLQRLRSGDEEGLRRRCGVYCINAIGVDCLFGSDSII